MYMFHTMKVALPAVATTAITVTRRELSLRHGYDLSSSFDLMKFHHRPSADPGTYRGHGGSARGRGREPGADEPRKSYLAR